MSRSWNFPGQFSGHTIYHWVVLGGQLSFSSHMTNPNWSYRLLLYDITRTWPFPFIILRLDHRKPPWRLFPWTKSDPYNWSRRQLENFLRSLTTPFCYGPSSSSFSSDVGVHTLIIKITKKSCFDYNVFLAVQVLYRSRCSSASSVGFCWLLSAIGWDASSCCCLNRWISCKISLRTGMQ